MSDDRKYRINPIFFGEVAHGFNFDSRHLREVDFPESFVKDYVSVFEDDHFTERLDTTGATYAAKTIGRGPIMFANIFSPDFIYSFNRILDESLYAPKGSIILPPGLYVIAEFCDDVDTIYLMINLAEDSPDYGKLFYWRKAHDALGTGDNTTPPVWAADTLADYFAGLMTEEEARAKLQLMACRRKPEL